MSMELPDPILQRCSLEKLVPLTWHPGGSLEQDLSFWTKSLETLVPDSTAHLLGGLGQLAQHIWACFFICQMTKVMDMMLMVSRCWMA